MLLLDHIVSVKVLLTNVRLGGKGFARDERASLLTVASKERFRPLSPCFFLGSNFSFSFHQKKS